MCGFIFYSGKELSESKFKNSLDKINHRGPDDTKLYSVQDMWIGFKRLAIMDTSHNGDQPFVHKEIHLVCNGEIYNYKDLKQKFSNYSYQSGSDCEVLIPLFREEGIKGITKRLDAEYAVIIYDEAKDSVYAARDAMGIRPLFYGHTKTDRKIVFGSEVKAIQELCVDIKPFPPGHYYEDGKFVEFCDLSSVSRFTTDSHKEVYKNSKK